MFESVTRGRGRSVAPVLAALLLSVVTAGVGTSAPADAQTATTYPTPINVRLDADRSYFVVLSSTDGILEAQTAGTVASFGYPDEEECERRLRRTDDECFTSEGTEAVDAIGFAGSGAQVRAALASLTFTPNAGVSLSAARLSAEIVVNPGGPGRTMYFNRDNGHYYEWVNTQNITWFDAFDAAKALTIDLGKTYNGYLATITTENEQLFAFRYVSAMNVWIGASDDFNVLNSIMTDIRQKKDDNSYGPYDGQYDANPGGDLMAEGRWYWVSGPEAGTLIGTGCGADWVTAVGQEAFWSRNQNSSEPNNHSSCTGGDRDVTFGEHYAVLNVNRDDALLNWNDYPATVNNNGFLAEFGPFGDDLAAAFTLDREFRITQLIPSSAPAATGPSLTCTPDPVAPGALVTCTVTGGDPNIDILWRASFGGTFAEAGVRLDEQGRGTFTFIAPRSAAGQAVSVVLVEWTDPLAVQVLSQTLPGSLPAGEGSGGVPGLPLLLAAGLLAGAVWRLRSGVAPQVG